MPPGQREATGDRRQATGNRQQATGNRQLAAGDGRPRATAVATSKGPLRGAVLGRTAEAEAGAAPRRGPCRARCSSALTFCTTFSASSFVPSARSLASCVAKMACRWPHSVRLPSGTVTANQTNAAKMTIEITKRTRPVSKARTPCRSRARPAATARGDAPRWAIRDGSARSPRRNARSLRRRNRARTGRRSASNCRSLSPGAAARAEHGASARPVNVLGCARMESVDHLCARSIASGTCECAPRSPPRSSPTRLAATS